MAAQNKEQKKSVNKHPFQTAEAANDHRNTQKERAAIPVSEVMTIKVDLAGSVSIALGAHPHIIQYRPQLIALPGFAIKNVDNLKTYTLAAWYAYLLQPPAPERTVAIIAAEVKPLRHTLLVGCEALADKGILDPSRVAAIRAGSGHDDQADDLLAMFALLSEKWDVIENKTAIEEHEVQRAAELGTEFRVALGGRAVEGPVDASVRADDRARAITLLHRSYNECRRGIAWIRWHEGDADTIAPSLFRRRSSTGARAGSDPEPEPAPAPAPIADPQPNGPGERPAPSGPVTPAPRPIV